MGPIEGNHMKRCDFAFDLPEGLIAQAPLNKRSDSRLLATDGTTGKISHLTFSDLPTLLSPDDLLIFNNTSVVAARLFARKQSGGRVEILIERVLADGSALAHIRASKSPRDDSLLFITPSKTDEVTALAFRVVGRREQLFHLCPELGTIQEAISKYGHVPLPPYIQRTDTLMDRERYQTIFARQEGSAASPTAGLHFDRPLMRRIEAIGVALAEVTLHVGAGTFRPVRVQDIRKHKMHSEYVDVGVECCEAVEACRSRGGRIVAVGTTTVRALECAARNSTSNRHLTPYQADTDIFFYPGCEFRVVDAMVTNFHLPESTLIMLVSAFAGSETIRKAYQSAISNRYRFFSYGDCMFIT